VFQGNYTEIKEKNNSQQQEVSLSTSLKIPEGCLEMYFSPHLIEIAE